MKLTMTHTCFFLAFLSSIFFLPLAAWHFWPRSHETSFGIKVFLFKSHFIEEFYSLTKNHSPSPHVHPCWAAMDTQPMSVQPVLLCFGCTSIATYVFVFSPSCVSIKMQVSFAKVLTKSEIRPKKMSSNNEREFSNDKWIQTNKTSNRSDGI